MSAGRVSGRPRRHRSATPAEAGRLGVGGVDDRSALSVETDMGYRRGEGRIDTLSMNGSLLWLLPRLGRSTPYAAIGALSRGFRHLLRYRQVEVHAGKASALSRA